MLKQKSISMRRGYTLVEILMATALALVLLTSAIRIFMMMNEGFAESRVLIELLGRVRSAQRILEADLSHYTTDMCPPRPVEADDGYFSVGHDYSSSSTAEASNEKIYRGGDTSYPMVDTSLVDDCFDCIGMTVFNKDAPFRYTNASGTTLETPYAEVLWFVYKNDLYRFLVPIVFAQDQADTSTRPRYETITLAALGDPENRLERYCLPQISTLETDGTLQNYMVLPNVIAFQVQLWDPIQNIYRTLDSITESASDTDYYRYHNVSAVEGGALPVYDTWSAITMLETTASGTYSPIEDSRLVVSNNSMFTSTTAENAPPSRSFLPGVRVIVRAFDPDSGQVREFRVAQDFRRR
ncbi:MAG: prepilin-type N-terminal cleavage/methylation domain-containing protein [Planctomycetia bacterium]|nr:prepilin-type N-terminal cleavage/methylation domain-containing protein [Planctomycetia bacterium]